MNSALRWRSVLLTVAAAACVSPAPVSAPPRVVLSPAAEAFTRGDLVRVILTNETSRAVFRKQCETTLQRRVDSSWIVAGGTTCGREAPAWQRVEPGGTIRLDVPTLVRLEAGQYRVVVPIQHEDETSPSEQLLNSSPFRLR